MPLADTDPVGLHAPGIYERVRQRELSVARAPDPRLSAFTDSAERKHQAVTAPPYSPTPLGQIEALIARQPVRIPRWYLGGHTFPEVRDWAPYADRRHQWFVLTPDDRVTPG
ncbi:hypothetical protein [Mycolicibacterium pulveris]|uniref:hypothetical protein n=1 Tax=Mycolicibacterium pulveris TaxID=36813 RepID=UPI003CE87A57